jgi:hypothetical protein
VCSRDIRVAKHDGSTQRQADQRGRQGSLWVYMCSNDTQVRRSSPCLYCRSVSVWQPSFTTSLQFHQLRTVCSILVVESSPGPLGAMSSHCRPFCSPFERVAGTDHNKDGAQLGLAQGGRRHDVVPHAPIRIGNRNFPPYLYCRIMLLGSMLGSLARAGMSIHVFHVVSSLSCPCPHDRAAQDMSRGVQMI